MTRLFWLSACLLLASTAVVAQTAFVRSGEHATYTRLVMKLKSDTAWSISQANRMARVQIARPEIQFDTSEVFSRIPRTRLQNLAQSKKNGPLELTLNCDCNVEGFMHAGNYLVVDIRDPKPSEFRLHPVPGEAGAPAYSFNLGSEDLQSQPAHIDRRRPMSPDLPLDPQRPDAGGTPSMVVGNSLSEERLLAQIERAASQGLLTPIAQQISQGEEPNEEEVDARRSPVRQAKPAVNLAATTVIDRDLSGVAGALGTIATEDQCLPARYFAIQDWGDQRTFADQIGDQRNQLFHEFDELSTNAAFSLAKTYLHFGFGAEARAVLVLIEDQDRQKEALLALSDILDGRRVTQEEYFLGQSVCQGNLPLWSLMSGNYGAAEFEADDVLQAFSRLPRHLRQQLGPQLSRQLTNSGRHELASGVLRAVDRRTDFTEPAQDLAAAEIETATGQVDVAIDKMAKVLETDSDSSPEALIRLVEAHVTERRAPRPDLPDLAGAYAAEHRLGELGPELRRAHTMSLALSGRYEEAIDVLKDIRELDIPSASDSATVSVLEVLAENAGDVAFLTYALPWATPDRPEFPNVLENLVAERLLGLGFAEQANAFLDRSGSQSDSERSRLLRAEIALANGLPHRAMIEVLSLTSPEASDIRARAMRENGDYVNSGQMLLDADRSEQAVRDLWLGGAWEKMPSTDDPRYGRLAELSEQLTRQVDSDDTTPSLTRARNLLEDSAGARAGINDILSSLRVENFEE